MCATNGQGRVLKGNETAREARAANFSLALAPPTADVDVLRDLAAHDVSVLFHLLGAKPVEVSAYAERCLHSGFWDVTFIRLHFGDGFFSEHQLSWLSSQKVRRFSVDGSDGPMTFDDAREKDKLHKPLHMPS